MEERRGSQPTIDAEIGSGDELENCKSENPVSPKGPFMGKRKKKRKKRIVEQNDLLKRSNEKLSRELQSKTS